MHTSTTLAALLFGAAALAAPFEVLEARGEAESNSTANNLDLIHDLELAPTAEDRVNMLTSTDFVYDFNFPPNGSVTMGAGGHTVKADRKLFPALIGTGVSMTLGFINACGFNTPHVHPRGTEINVVVEGSLFTEFVTENGVDVIGPNLLDKFQMTVFPQGATHTEWNPNCEPAVFVAGFNSEDPGVQQNAQTLFELSPELVQADLGVVTLNGEDINKFDSLLPPNVALGVRSCLKKCGIKPVTPNQGNSGKESYGPGSGSSWGSSSSASGSYSTATSSASWAATSTASASARSASHYIRQGLGQSDN